MSDHHSKRRSVEFFSDGLKIRGEVHLPDGDGPHPIVVLGHGLGALKEWTMPDLVSSFAQVGIAGLWFDYRNFGDSEGLPREEVSHYGRLEDWQSAISFATSLPEIDPERIGVWGTSLGGRDVLAISSFDRRIKAVLAQTPVIKWFPALAARMAGYDDLDRFQEELADDRKNRSLGEEPRYLPFVKATGDDIKDSFVKQLTEAELRNYKGRLTLQTYQATTLVDITPFVELISPTPICFILADEDFLPGQREAYNMAKVPKSLVEIKGHHYSPYITLKRYTTEVAEKVFVKYLMTSNV
ncbi:Fc.00g093300.m01.CDS01 [Cosmosporella sp. VM-42]